MDEENNKGYLSDFGSKIYTAWSGLKTPSTGSLTYAPLSSVSSYKDQWNAWYEWQKIQPVVHFQRSDVFKKYASKNNVPFDLIFKPEVTYVLGDFKYFVPFNFINNEDMVWEHVKILLDLYDCCKGIRRNVFGDSNYIIVLKKAFHEKNMTSLLRYDYNECNYNMDKLHCHTIAYFSLSTLIMRFISHLIFLQYGKSMAKYPHINDITFDNMYRKDCYGYQRLLTGSDSLYDTIPYLHESECGHVARSSPLAIPGRQTYCSQNKSIAPRSDPSSCHYLSSSFNMCPGCGKSTATSKKGHCQDCYNKKIELIEFYNNCDKGLSHEFKQLD